MPHLQVQHPRHLRGGKALRQNEGEPFLSAGILRVGAAARAVEDGHRVAHLDVLHVGANGLHDTGALVADNKGQLVPQIGVVAAAHEVVGLTNADHLIPHQNFISLRHGLWHIGVNELLRPAELFNDDCFHMAPPILYFRTMVRIIFINSIPGFPGAVKYG